MKIWSNFELRLTCARQLHNTLLRMLPALAFLPAGDVIEGFEELVDTIKVLYDDVAVDLLQYFEDTYNGRYGRNAPRHPPHFAINLWNMFNRTDDELPRTNNSVEGCHWTFQGLDFPRPRICMSSCVLEIFIRPSKRRKQVLYLNYPAPCGTSSTPTKATLFGFKLHNSQNTGQLSKLARASVLEGNCP